MFELKKILIDSTALFYIQQDAEEFKRTKQEESIKSYQDKQTNNLCRWRIEKIKLKGIEFYAVIKDE